MGDGAPQPEVGEAGPSSPGPSSHPELDPTRCYYPMYLIKPEALSSLTRLVTHEEALEAGMLLKVERVVDGRFSNKTFVLVQGKPKGKALKAGCKVLKESIETADTRVYFFSHRWLTPSLDPALAHPDDDFNTKLRAVKSVIGGKRAPGYAWLDYMCIPQADPQGQLLAIQSLPFYVNASARFTSLVNGKAGREEYLGRMWCQAELIASKLPLRLPAWDPSWLGGVRGRFRDISGETTGEAAILPILLEHIGDPAQADLTVEADRAKLAPLLACAAGELEALLAWDASPDRAKTRLFGRGAKGIDEDEECRKRGVSRAALASLAKKLRAASVV